MFANYILNHEIKVNGKVINCVQKYIYLDKFSVSPDHGKINQNKNREGMGWSAFDRQYNAIKSHFQQSMKRGKFIISAFYHFFWDRVVQ